MILVIAGILFVFMIGALTMGFWFLANGPAVQNNYLTLLLAG